MNADTEQAPEFHVRADGRVVEVSSFEVIDGLPATPEGLLRIAGVFERYGYARLSAYLRACADQMSAERSRCAANLPPPRAN